MDKDIWIKTMMMMVMMPCCGQTLFTVDGDTLVEEISGPFSSKIVRAIEGDLMVMVSKENQMIRVIGECQSSVSTARLCWMSIL